MAASAEAPLVASLASCADSSSERGTDSATGVTTSASVARVSASNSVGGRFGTRESGECGGLFSRARRGDRRLSGLFPLSLQGLALHVPHLLFKRALEVRRGLSEFRHKFAEGAREFRQLLGTKYHQNDNEEDDHVGHAEHSVWQP